MEILPNYDVGMGKKSIDIYVVLRMFHMLSLFAILEFPATVWDLILEIFSGAWGSILVVWDGLGDRLNFEYFEIPLGEGGVPDPRNRVRAR